MQVNHSFRLLIEAALCKTQFSLEDFDITYPSYGDLVTIEFKHHEGFKISLEEVEFEETETLKLNKGLSDHLALGLPSSFYGEPDTKTVTKTKYVSTESPGSIKATDDVTIKSLTEFPRRFIAWTSNIEAELLSIYSLPESPENDLESQIEAIFPNEIAEPTSKFDASEVSKLKESLETLYKRVEQLQEQCAISSSELESLRKALDNASESAPKYPKGMWLKLNKGKIKESLVAIFKSEEGRQFLLKVVEKITLT
ncbi:hypothetical protein VIOR103205_11585 [Vibrio ordalii]|uniref:hypothetical protein n=1 Tax=Vibrio ordalii TaxID=28174 RepID=UPI0002483577|nr:hypothetical protein [Vibrio ordalii]